MTAFVPVQDDAELGRTRYCAGCSEWWPLDDEFWYRERGRPFALHCRACMAEAKHRDEAKPMRLCTSCRLVLTPNRHRRRCQGCQGTRTVPLTIGRLRELGLPS